ncbi:metal-dependent hydrolase [Aquimarina sp. RZ0]|uniref:metal-dependent hydrolase n=1 Tax=Aquimarina sp. RZ0 TaxID=2607730 RepID=UPI0011F1658E|nr:metal-dependent hydrolase [Aquimarina sp. RZ0]KAA1244011.1 metal-dependent hydrolase [Aquimarina sp. RZ0]
MDSLTQIVLGAAVGETAIGKKVGNKAMLWGAIAGTIPDLDVLFKYFVDNVTANELHRGFSHSVLFSILMAPLLGSMVAKLYKNKEADWKDWTKLMFLGLFTHPILDAFTTWGTQLFWPLSYKVSFKNIFVVDPLYTIPFLSMVILAMFYKRTDPKRRKLNNLGLIVSSIYMIITVGFKWYTYRIFQNSLENQGIIYKEIQTKPTPLNSLLWTTNVETENSFMIGYYSLLDDDNAINFTEYPKNHYLIQSMKNDPLISRLIKLSQGWYTIENKNGKIIFNDLRFGQLGINTENGRFVFSYELYYDANGKLQARERKPDIQKVSPLLKKLFTRVLGNKL